MNADEETRFAGITHALTRDLQGMARRVTTETDPERQLRQLRDMRSWVNGVKRGLALMGMMDPAIKRSLEKAGWNESLKTCKVYDKRPFWERPK